MAIKLAAVAEVEKKVSAWVPNAAGDYIESSFRVTYKLLSVAAFRETVEQQMDNAEAMPDDDIMRRDVTAIRDVKGEDGKDTPFSTELLDALMNRADTRQAIVKGWRDVQTNHAEHAEKN